MRTICTLIFASTVLPLFTVGTSYAVTPVGEKITYKTIGDRELSLYVTKPDNWQATDKRPAVVFFHGGGWVGGSPGQFTEHSKYLASRGLVCVQVEYRLLDRNNKDLPTNCVHDAKSAMRWVRSHADELGIDPNRIASGGGSAGGHLAAFVGTVDGLDDPQDDTKVSPKSNAMLLFNPVYNNGPDGWGTAGGGSIPKILPRSQHHTRRSAGDRVPRLTRQADPREDRRRLSRPDEKERHQVRINDLRRLWARFFQPR